MTGYGNYWISAPEDLNEKAWFAVYSTEENVAKWKERFMTEIKIGNGYGSVQMNDGGRMRELCGNQQPMPLIKNGEAIYDGKVVARFVGVYVDKNDCYCGKYYTYFVFEAV